MNLLLVTLFLTLAGGGEDPLDRAVESCDLAAAEQALRRSEPADELERLWDRARVDLLRGETERAVEALARVVEENPGSAEYRLWYSRALYARASETSTLRGALLARRATAELKKALEIAPAHPDAAIDLILIHLRVPLIGGGRDAAEKLARSLSRGHSTAAPLARAILAYEGENWSAAERELGRALQLTRDRRRVLFWLGFLYQRQQRWDEAFAAHEKLLELSPNDPRVWYEFARTADFSGQRRELGKRMLARYRAARLPSGAPSKQEAKALLVRLNE